MLGYKPPAQHFAYKIAALGNLKNLSCNLRRKIQNGDLFERKAESANNCYWVGVLSLLKKTKSVKEYRK